MIIVYRPADGAEQHFDARTLRVSEVSIVARTIDQKWPAIQQGLTDEDLDAMRGVAWVIAKRTDPTLRFGDFDPRVGELVTRLDQTEITAYTATAVELAREEPDTTEEKVRALVEAYVLPAALDQEHAQRTIDKALAETPKGPGPESSEPTTGAPTSTSESSETSTSASSPTSSTSPLEPSTTS